MKGASAVSLAAQYLPAGRVDSDAILDQMSTCSCVVLYGLGGWAVSDWPALLKVAQLAVQAQKTLVWVTAELSQSPVHMTFINTLGALTGQERIILWDENEPIHPVPLAYETLMQEAQQVVAAISLGLAQSPSCHLGVVLGGEASPLRVELKNQLDAAGILYTDTWGLQDRGGPGALLQQAIAMQCQPDWELYQDWLETLMDRGLVPLGAGMGLRKKIKKAKGYHASCLSFVEGLDTADWGQEDMCLVLAPWPRQATFAQYAQRTQALLAQIGLAGDRALEAEWTPMLRVWAQSDETLVDIATYAEAVAYGLEALDKPTDTLATQARVHLLKAHEAQILPLDWVHVGGLTEAAWWTAPRDCQGLATEALKELNRASGWHEDGIEGAQGWRDSGWPHAHRPRKSLPQVGYILNASEAIALEQAALERLKAIYVGKLSASFTRLQAGNLSEPQRLHPWLAGLPDAPTACASDCLAWPTAEGPSERVDVLRYQLHPQDPRCPLVLPCKTWEAVFTYPERVWHDAILKLEDPYDPERGLSPALILGTWVHDWIAYKPGQWTPRPEAQAWKVHVETQARQAYERLLGKQSQAGVEARLAPWREGLFQEALQMALDIVQQLTELNDVAYMACEWPIPEGTQLVLPGQVLPVTLRGRLDLVLAPCAPVQPAVLPDAVWVLDFKTGPKDPLSLKGLEGGEGLQLALYGAVLHALGVQKVHMSFVPPYGTLDKAEALDFQQCLQPGTCPVFGALTRKAYAQEPLLAPDARPGWAGG
jgi:hypothetical protein